MRSTWLPAAVALVAAAHVAIPGDVQAQTNGSIAVSGGVATDQLGQRASALSIAPRLTTQLAPGLRAALGGSVVRYASDALSLGAGLDLSANDSWRGIVGLALDASGMVSQLRGSASGSFAAAEVRPSLEVRAGALTAFGGLRAAAGSASGERRATGFPPIGAPVTTRASRSGTGHLFGARLAANQQSVPLALSARQEVLRVSGVPVTDRSLGLDVAGARAALSLAVGQRSAPDERLGTGSASLSLLVSRALSLDLSGGRYASNRILGTPAGEYFAAGLSWRFGGEREWTPPEAERVAPPARGRTRLAIRAPHATRVEVAGDFNEWTPVAAQRAPNGVWYADLVIPPGRYRYAFRVDGAAWRVPDGATAVDDGFGGKSAWLTVPEPASR